MSSSGPMLRIEFAPIALTVDGTRMAEAVYPPIEARLDAWLAGEMTTIRVTAPPGGTQNTGVGGPTP